MTDPQPTSPPTEQPAVANPFVSALTALGGIALGIGVIATIVGVANGASYDPGTYSGHYDNGLGEIAVGTLFCDVGGLVLIAGLIVAGIDWSIRHHLRRD